MRLLGACPAESLPLHSRPIGELSSHCPHVNFISDEAVQAPIPVAPSYCCALKPQRFHSAALYENHTKDTPYTNHIPYQICIFTFFPAPPSLIIPAAMDAWTYGEPPCLPKPGRPLPKTNPCVCIRPRCLANSTIQLAMPVHARSHLM